MCPALPHPPKSLTASRAGAAAVKVYPASQLGGPGNVKALLGPIPHRADCDRRGSTDDATSCLNAGAVAAGIAGPLIDNALIQDPAALGTQVPTAGADYREGGD